MKRRSTINRILCAVIILALLSGIVLMAVGGSKLEPEDPLRDTADELLAEPQDGGSTSQREQPLEEPEVPPEEPPEEPEEPPEEEPEEPPEDEA